jgi:hypothetical protein
LSVVSPNFSKTNPLLKEIFSALVQETESYLLLKGLATRASMGDPDNNAPGNRIYIAMQDYGIDPFLKNHNPLLDDEPARTPNYSHLISFYIVPVSEDYGTRLQLIEALVELFEVKPFFQLVINKEEYELSISMKSVSTSEYQQFWISRGQPSQPVIFYQARVSSL